MILQDRSHMLQKARAFFLQRGLLEVDCGALVTAPAIDANIDVMSLEVAPGCRGYLHTSPEYAMKRLLSQGAGDLFYLGRVFRYGEIGDRHHPEFTMAEWYRIGFSFEQMIQETAEWIALFLGAQPVRQLRYWDAFRLYANMDAMQASLEELQIEIRRGSPSTRPEGWSRDACLQFLFAERIEPQLGSGELTAIVDYPATQAALAQLRHTDQGWVAERFEMYSQGVELCNGYHELADPVEQRRRFIEENQARTAAGKEPYPHDEHFLDALARGLPDCSGVAVGFDRLMSLRHACVSLREVISSTWS